MINVRALLHMQNSASEWVPVQEDPIIHNYFPDGAPHSAALIDVAKEQDFDVHVWEPFGGSETLSFVPTNGISTPNAVVATLPGDGPYEGVYGMDWDNLYGCGQLPVGRYNVGVTVWWVGPDSPNIPFRIVPLVGGVESLKSVQEITHLLGGGQRRFVMSVYLLSPGPIGLSVVAYPQDRAVDTPDPQGTLHIARVIVTEGDAWAYADGDSSGWSWSGTAHASASHGPQP